MTGGVVVLGATGSVGRQALDVLRARGERPRVLTAHRDAAGLAALCREFLPEACVIADEKYNELKLLLTDTPVRVSAGPDALCAAAALPGRPIVLNAIVGIGGLLPTLAAVRTGNTVALANKETLVVYGTQVMREARENGVPILPVDSEHSAIFQCLRGEDGNRVRRLLLTASGGPFYGKTRDELRAVTPALALAHPSWRMGPKITVDSSTMMNKGFEIIEAAHLFGLPQEKVEVLIHRESVVQSMVEFEDGAVKAQLSKPDMRLCIQYALTYPSRCPSPVEPLSFTGLTLGFEAPDTDTFFLLKKAREAFDRGGNACAALNGANEAAVAAFLAGKLGYLELFALVARAMDAVPYVAAPSLEDILETDRAARAFVNGGCC